MTVTYHILGLNCPELPAQLMGTNHGVTWFPTQANCSLCRVEWDRRQVLGQTIPEMVEDPPGSGLGHIAIPQMKVSHK